MKVLVNKATGRIIESQSGDDKKGLEVLLKNAASSGLKKADVAAKIVPDDEFDRMMAGQIAADRTYADERRAAYPTVAEQLDMLWHALGTGKPLDKGSAFFTAIAAVKEKFPKP